MNCDSTLPCNLRASFHPRRQRRWRSQPAVEEVSEEEQHLDVICRSSDGVDDAETATAVADVERELLEDESASGGTAASARLARERTDDGVEEQEALLLGCERGVCGAMRSSVSRSSRDSDTRRKA